ncbi:hypothetical protein WMF30_45305 [Sorangium sp. So ce134]
MIKMFRGFGTLAAAGVALMAGLGGCAMQPGSDDAKLGSLSLPLAAEAQSGARYRLRNATFEIRSGYYWYEGTGGDATGSTSGGGGIYGTPLLTINTEDEDPDASSILVDLEQGYYSVRLLPGWNFEKVQGGTATEVEATLLSSETIYVYVSPRSTTWAQYQFGIGDRALWLNGKLNLNIGVYEDPEEYYGGAGGYEAAVSVSVGVGTGSGGAGGGGGFIETGGGSP